MTGKSSQFEFTDEVTMAAYLPKKGRMVHVLSTLNSDDSVSQNPNQKLRSMIIIRANEVSIMLTNLYVC